MPDGSQSPEQSPRPDYKKEIVQYKDGHLVVSLSGEPGAQYEFGEKSIFKYDPVRYRSTEGIVRTKSGNEYFITHDDISNLDLDQERRTYVVNIGETKNKQKLVAAYTSEYPAPLLPLEFGEPWDIPNFCRRAALGQLPP